MSKAASKRHYDRNREAYLERQRAYQAAHRDVTRAASRRWKANNRERNKAYMAAYAEANKESLAAKDAARHAANAVVIAAKRKAYVEANRGLINAHQAARRAAKSLATPAWLTPEQRKEMRAIYEDAASLTASTGIKHVVDHRVPLRGVNVCGLHVPGNLQVLTALANNQKYNKVETHNRS